EKRPDPTMLGLAVWGRKFTNPIGLAAGFDKNAQAVEGLLGFGFGFVEVGSVTPMSQEGNPKPRIFRLRKEGAIINRCGFNNEGIAVVAKRLGALGKRKMEGISSTSPSLTGEVKHGGKAGSGILGVNIGKNKTTEDAVSDYVKGVQTLSQYADYLVFFVINISSPNTPGLRKLQGRKQLKELVKKVRKLKLFVQAARDEMQWAEEGPPPLVVKIAPDLSKEDIKDIADVSCNMILFFPIVNSTYSYHFILWTFRLLLLSIWMDWKSEVLFPQLTISPQIISNTTISRPDPVSSHPLAGESGGLSGKPLFDMSTSILKEMYILTQGKIPLIGCGGVSK
ncbi:hypothetical protein BHM03_00053447, partial [Ensete ventricosum]